VRLWSRKIIGAQSQRGTILEWFVDRDAADWDEYTDAAHSGTNDPVKTVANSSILFATTSTTMWI